LWRTDGTSARTALVSNIAGFGFPYSGAYGVGGSKFFFSDQDSTVGRELYVYEGSPVAVDVSGTSSDGKNVQFSVLSTAYVSGGTIDPASVKIASQPTHGTVMVGADGVITYIPSAGYSGDDSFTYTVADTSGTMSPAAKAAVTVTAPAPAPTKSGGGAISTAELVFLFAVLFVFRSTNGFKARKRSNPAL